MPDRPNILFFFTDDQRFDTIAAAGHPDIKTPNLDALLARGTHFSHAHIPGGTSGAVCMPSRAMLHSGRSLFRLADGGSHIPQEHTTLGEHLRAHGYQTFGTGKWHNGKNSYSRSFSDGGEIFFGGMADHWNVPAHDYDPTGAFDGTCPLIVDPFKTKEVAHRGCDHINGGTHSTDLLSGAVSDWLEGYDSEDPFFAYVSYLAPHDPRSMPQQYRDMYDENALTLPDNCWQVHPFDLGVHQIRDEALAQYPRKEQEMREHLADYYAMITHLDARVGKVLEALEATGKADSTIIVFAGDNGLAVGQHGLLGKQNLYDHPVRVPLIFAGPGVPEGETRDDFAFLYQIFGSLCDLAGLPVPESVEGKSLFRNEPLREEVYLAYTQLHRAVRTPQHKLIRCRVDGNETVQLFDLEADPWECENLAESADHAALRSELSERMEALSVSTGDRDSSWGQKFWGE